MLDDDHMYNTLTELCAAARDAVAARKKERVKYGELREGDETVDICW